jgi:glycosyltransferase involved in cell wall biosynthesis
MKKILIVTDNLRTQINGVVTTFKSIESFALDDGFDIVYLDPGQFNYINCPGYPDVKLSWPWCIGKKIKEINPDHIHIATEGPLGLATRIFCDRNGYRYNTSYHTKFPEYLKKIYNIPIKYTYDYVRWFHKHSGKVLTTTKTMVDELVQNGFTPDPIPWTRGVDSNIFNSGYRKPNQVAVNLLCVSRLSKEKNVEHFCELDFPNCNKIVVGDGPYRNTLELRYPDVEFVGFKTGTELAEYYANADVLVFPSQTDTFGVVIIESMNCGTPVAAFPVTGPKDIVEQNVTGYLDWDLKLAVNKCLDLDRNVIESLSRKWTWKNCWQIFKENLI